MGYNEVISPAVRQVSDGYCAKASKHCYELHICISKAPMWKTVMRHSGVQLFLRHICLNVKNEALADANASFFKQRFQSVLLLHPVLF